MLKFVGGSTIIILTVSGLLYFAGYWNGSLDVNMTDRGQQVVGELTTEGKRTLNSGLDSLKVKLNATETTTKPAQ